MLTHWYIGQEVIRCTFRLQTGSAELFEDNVVWQKKIGVCCVMNSSIGEG